MLRVGVIGAGFGRQVHVPALRAAGCRVDAICAGAPAKAQGAAAELGIPRAAADWRELVADPAAWV